MSPSHWLGRSAPSLHSVEDAASEIEPAVSPALVFPLGTPFPRRPLQKDHHQGENPSRGTQHDFIHVNKCVALRGSDPTSPLNQPPNPRSRGLGQAGTGCGRSGPRTVPAFRGQRSQSVTIRVNDRGLSTHCDLQ